jgi:hypothetical protein
VVRRAKHRPAHAIALLLVVAMGACTSSSGTGDGGSTAQGRGDDPSGLNAEVASVDLVAGQPQRFLVGVFAQSGLVLSFGEVSFRFIYLGTKAQPSAPVTGPTTTASYVPTPGTPDTRSAPTLTQPSQGRGVYQAEGVRFDSAGIWRVEVRADVDGRASSAAAAFTVLDKPRLPDVGQPALHTENLTLRTKGAPPEAIDSRAADGGSVPDPQLHQWTIADALDRHLPILVTFATPVYCTSRFCGPTVEEVAQLQRRFADRAVFIHVEIWRDYQNSVVNQAAADWVYRGGDLTEPWTFLVGADGRILDRWGSLFDASDVSAELAKLPRVSIPSPPSTSKSR